MIEFTIHEEPRLEAISESSTPRNERDRSLGRGNEDLSTHFEPAASENTSDFLCTRGTRNVDNAITCFVEHNIYDIQSMQNPLHRLQAKSDYFSPR